MYFSVFYNNIGAFFVAVVICKREDKTYVEYAIKQSYAPTGGDLLIE